MAISISKLPAPRKVARWLSILFTVSAGLGSGFELEVQADVRLPKIFGNHMVLQQGKPIRVFGWAEAGEKVEVTLAGNSESTVTDESGRWQVKLPMMKATAEPQKLVVQGNNRIELGDILIGEVWICSGQSNMEWSVRASANAESELAQADHPNIRLFNVPQHLQFDSPQEDTPGTWQPCNASTLNGFTAVGYYFGRKVQKETGVPVGLVGTNWGGTRIEPWTPPVGFESVPELNYLAKAIREMDPKTADGKAYFEKYLNNVEQWVGKARKQLGSDQVPAPVPTRQNLGQFGGATRIYNGMVHGLAPFTVRGAIWYQGESNAGDGLKYQYFKKALVLGWRSVFQDETLSFYWVQLANFQAPLTNPAGGGWGPVREAQRRALELPNTGMAVTIDIGNARDIHPRNKQDVGMRLARWALRDHYGQKNLVPSGPLFKSMAIEDGKIRVSFDFVGTGLMVGKKQGMEPTQEASEPLKRFAIAGADKKWHWAEASIDGDTVVVSSPEVPKPVAVRFGYESNPEGINLYNREGLPASPFKTDDW